ncbi:MAG TPA: vitamin K epoxide reductase family protein [Candidatus Paceibacterota bacterium]|jgi:uncharacterized membrane protein|nr:vitamin K epoxide reductase family protein [Candidatus Paceibacterota bacterium]
MHIPIDALTRIALAGLGLAGFVVARHIHVHKKAGRTPLVCPVNFNCHAVVHSSYSKFLGVPVEIFGMVYYAFVFLAYTILFFMPYAVPPSASVALILLALAAFIFSLYLVIVQIFAIKEGCFWCYISSLIVALIFIITLLAYVTGALHL